MKKTINKIAKYIAGISGLLLLLLLACTMNAENNKIADVMVLPVLIVFLVTMIVFLVVYIVHAVWMIQEKKKPSKGTVLLWCILCIALLAINYWQGSGMRENISRVIMLFVVCIFGEIGSYIYSWKEDGSDILSR